MRAKPSARRSTASPPAAGRRRHVRVLSEQTDDHRRGRHGADGRDDIAREVSSLRSQGRSDDRSWLRHQRIGYNYRLDELSAAVGLAQFRRLDELLQKREAVAAMYTERLRGIHGIAPLPPPRPGMNISWFIYVIRVENGINRDALAADLAARGIPTRPYFWPIHLQPPYANASDSSPAPTPTPKPPATPCSPSRSTAS